MSFTDFKTEECSRTKVVAMVMNPIVSFKRWLALWIATSHEIALNFRTLLYLHMAASLPPPEARSMSLHERRQGLCSIPASATTGVFNRLVMVLFIIRTRHHYVPALNSYLLPNNEHTFS